MEYLRRLCEVQRKSVFNYFGLQPAFSQKPSHMICVLACSFLCKLFSHFCAAWES